MARKNAGLFIGEALRRSWRIWRAQPLNFIAITLVALITPYVPGAISTALGDEAGIFSVLLLLLSLILSLLVNLGLLRVSLRAADGDSVELADVFQEWPRLGSFIVACSLYSLIILAGTFFFVIPGIIWAIKFQYYPFFTLQGYSPLRALQLSARITTGRKWDLLGLQVVLSAVIMLGILLFGISVLAAIPIALIANALVFRQLNKV